MTRARSSTALLVLGSVLFIGMSAALAEARDAHVYGAGQVSIDQCGGTLNIHATDVGHPGQYLDIRALCGASATEVHVDGGPDCLLQKATTAYAAYKAEGVRLVIEDGGPGVDAVAVSLDSFKKATPANRCGTRSLEPSAATGEFLVGLP